MDKQNAMKILLEVKQVMGRRHWWIDCGTLLGAIRNNDFIEWDTDLDVGILQEDWNDNLAKKLIKRGFELKHEFGFREAGYEISFKKYGVKIDFFLYYRLDDIRWFACWKNGFRNGESDIIKLVYPAEMVEKRKFILFNGYELPVPFNSEDYLTIRYGNWLIEDRGFKLDKDPKNIV